MNRSPTISTSVRIDFAVRRSHFTTAESSSWAGWEAQAALGKGNFILFSQPFPYNCPGHRGEGGGQMVNVVDGKQNIPATPK